MTESELISEARNAVSESDWIVGRCASEWCQRYSKGRTDSDFGHLIGMSGDQIRQRRAVWDAFGEKRIPDPNLNWSHYYAAVTWSDAAECLEWASQNEASIGEMKAWRRLQRGDEILFEAEDQGGPAVTDEGADLADTGRGAAIGLEPIAARPPEVSHSGTPAESQQTASSATMATLADSDTSTAYAPFKAGSSKPRAEDDAGNGANRDAVLIRKTCVAVGASIRKTDDARAFVVELLAECWRHAQGDTADAIKEFIADKPLCR